MIQLYRRIIVLEDPSTSEQRAAFGGRKRDEASPRIDAAPPRASGRTGQGNWAREGLLHEPDRASVFPEFIGPDFAGDARPTT